jgi:AcrR family transcriptional regulator
MQDGLTDTEEPAPGPVPLDADPAVPVDGRTARAQRTRDAIVEACVALVSAGDVRPTAPRIAEEAGVSVRSVFQHFDDLETLFTMVAERAIVDIAQLVRPVDPMLPFDRRLEEFVAQRASVLEALTPIRRAAAVHAPVSPAIRERVKAGHGFFRAQLAAVFERELVVVADDRRAQVLDMLDVTATWSSWDVLRTLDGRSPAEAAAVMAALLRLVLGMGKAPP